MDEAQDGQHRRTLVIPQAKMLLQVADRQLDRETRPIELDDLERRKRQVRSAQDDGFLDPLKHHDPHLLGDVALLHVSDNENDLSQLPIRVRRSRAGVSAVIRVANVHFRSDLGSGAPGPSAGSGANTATVPPMG